MNSSVIKASESASARCRSSGDRASPIIQLVDKNVASFVQIYPPDHNILDFSPVLFSNSLPGGVLGEWDSCFSHSYANLKIFLDLIPTGLFL